MRGMENVILRYNQGSKVKWYCKPSYAPKSKSKSSGNAQGTSSSNNPTSVSKIFTNTESNVQEFDLLPNPLISVTSNVTTTHGNAGMFNTDSKLTNGKPSQDYQFNLLDVIKSNTEIGTGGIFLNAGMFNTDSKLTNGKPSQDYQFNLLDVIKSNTEIGTGGIFLNVGISVFGLNDISLGVNLSTDVLNSNINIGISEDINRDNTSTGYNIGVQPLGGLLILGAMRTGILAPLLTPKPVLSY